MNDVRQCACGGTLTLREDGAVGIVVRRHQTTDQHQEWIEAGGIESMAGPESVSIPAYGSTYEHGYRVPVDGKRVA